ncbi:MAG: F0F1 ATP synthase subunit delta, partial [Bdellovibrionales bacterium]|nr:F0F1 ATP synthase subunit delta [Bdellovibrionales bacterium]
MAGEQHKVAGRYAKALVTALEPSELESMRADLDAMSKAWVEMEELRAVCLNPSFGSEFKKSILSDVSAKIRSKDKTLANLLLVLVDNRRLSSIPLVAEAFSKMVDEIR